MWGNSRALLTSLCLLTPPPLLSRLQQFPPGGLAPRQCHHHAQVRVTDPIPNLTTRHNGLSLTPGNREIITIQAGQCGNSSECPIQPDKPVDLYPVLRFDTWQLDAQRLTFSSRKPVLATVMSGTRHQSRRNHRGLCDRRRRP